MSGSFIFGRCFLYLKDILVMELIYPPYTADLYPPPNVDSPSPESMHGEEIFPVVEPNGIVTGRMTRSYAHGGSMLLHPVVHLHIINRFGEIYLQKRSMTKDFLPGMWDTAVGGHVKYGESIAEALYRESWEELSLSEFNPTPLMNYVYQSRREKELVCVFACVGNFVLNPRNDEVDEGAWWSPEKIKESMGKGILTPNFEGEYPKIRRKLEALL